MRRRVGRSQAFRGRACLKNQAFARPAYAVIVLLLVIAVPLSGLRFSSPTEVYLKVVGAIAGAATGGAGVVDRRALLLGAATISSRDGGWMRLSVAVECSVPTGVIWLYPAGRGGARMSR